MVPQDGKLLVFWNPSPGFGAPSHRRCGAARAWRSGRWHIGGERGERAAPGHRSHPSLGVSKSNDPGASPNGAILGALKDKPRQASVALTDCPWLRLARKLVSSQNGNADPPWQRRCEMQSFWACWALLGAAGLPLACLGANAPRLPRHFLATLGDLAELWGSQGALRQGGADG